MSETTTTAPRLENLRPTAITPHPKNPRTQLGDLAELTESIRGSGVLEPLIVAPAKGRNKFTLIAGHRRHAAASKAGLKTVPCIVRDDLTDDRAQLEVMLTENLHRSDLNVVEEGNAYQSLLEFDDVDIRRLAASTGHTQKTIKSRITIAKSPETVQAKLLAKDITLDDAIAVAEFEDDAENHGKLVTALGSYTFPHLLEYARRQRQFRKDVAKVRKQLEADGMTVFDDIETLSQDEEESHGTDTPYEWVPSSELDDDDRAKLTEDGSPIVVASVPSMGAAEGNFEEYVRMPVERSAGADGEDDEWVNPIFAADDRKTASQSPKAMAARAEKEKLTAELAAAAVVRRAFVAEKVSATVQPLAIHMARANLTRLIAPTGWGFELRAEFLGLPISTRDDDDQYEAAIANHINRWTLDQLVLAIEVAKSALHDRDMYGDEWSFRRAKSWRHLIIDSLGYEPADVERRTAETLAAEAE